MNSIRTEDKSQDKLFLNNSLASDHYTCPLFILFLNY
jgi:hypothetical protein